MTSDWTECTTHRYILLFRSFFLQHRGMEQTKALVLKGYQALHYLSPNINVCTSQTFCLAAWEQVNWSFQSSVMCRLGFLSLKLLSLTCYSTALPVHVSSKTLALNGSLLPCPNIPNPWTYKTPFSYSLSLYLYRRSVTDLAQQNLILCVSFCDPYQLISARFLWPFL
jgi:hypothetical protein